MGRFEDRVVLVTGAGSGLGRAVVQRLASEGASVAAFDINRAAAEATVADVTAAGGAARAYRVDVGDPESVDSAIKQLAGEVGFGRPTRAGGSTRLSGVDDVRGGSGS